MKAAQFEKFGGPEVIEINEVEKPTPNVDQVLIEVHDSTINPFDYKVRSGKTGMKLDLPITIGGNLAGVVTQIGSNVTDLKVGDQVYGQSYAFGDGSGAIAQFAVSKFDFVALKPKSIDFIKSAAIPLVGCSAIQALEQHMNVQSGQKILIHGGAGGIGSLAIQLAKHLGAYVATTVATPDIDFVKSLGADEVIDYTKQDFSDILKDYDGVYDTVGGEARDKSLKILKKGGILVSMLGEPSKELVEKYDVMVIGQNTQTDRKNLTRLAQLVDDGVLKPQIDKVFPFEQTQEAFEYAENNHPKGKVVIQIK